MREIKRPDLLVFRNADQSKVESIVRRLGGSQELPFTSETHSEMRELLALAVLAAECENSLWRATQMPDYHAKLRPQKRLHGQLGLPKSAVLPTVILKEEDRARLRQWQAQPGRPRLHIWHVFYDLAFGVAFDDLERRIREGSVEATKQTFQAPGGATTTKIIYKCYYHYAYPLGKSVEEPELLAAHVTDKNGHILPYVKFNGGRLQFSAEPIGVLDQAARDQSQVSRT